MRPTARNRFPASTSAAIALCACLSALQGCDEESVEVLRTPDQSELNAAIHYIGRAGGHPTALTTGSGGKPVYVVRVPPSEQHDARALLHQLSLPRPAEPETGATGISESMSESQLRPVRDRQRSLKTMIEALPGVVRAEVTVVLRPRQVAGARSDVEPQASVVVTHVHEAAESSEELRRTVEGLVRNGVEGIDRNSADAVRVVVRRVHLVSIQAQRAVVVEEATLARLGLQRNALGASSAVLLAGFLGLLGIYARGVGMAKRRP